MSGVPINFVDSVLDFPEDHAGGRLYRKDLPPGSAFLDLEYSHLEFTCPCGCGTTHCIPLCEGEKIAHAWLWNGNKEKPTLTPSIFCQTPCKWHGYLTDGIFKSV